jgi:HSP90 family molecular chaperone
MSKGNIGVTTENIFPVIKKFLYSDHEIFLREMVSNAIDATQKLKTLKEKGDFKGELGDLTVRVSLDADKGTLTISDQGIGMTAEEIDKYINQIAFSGVTDFLDKYKDTANAIIGHFGLGFYSSFMVSKKVEIITKSYKDGEKAVKWSCDGSPEFTIEETEKEGRGSDIILYIDDDCVAVGVIYKIDVIIGMCRCSTVKVHRPGIGAEFIALQHRLCVRIVVEVLRLAAVKIESVFILLDLFVYVVSVIDLVGFFLCID